jgi:hypothetical protein
MHVATRVAVTVARYAHFSVSVLHVNVLYRAARHRKCLLEIYNNSIRFHFDFTIQASKYYITDSHDKQIFRILDDAFD